MKVSINLLRYYTDIYKWSDDPAPDGVDKLIEKIGAQLGGVEETVSLGKKYEGAVVVKVVSCEQHPNADRLHVCKIDDGGAAEHVSRDEKGLVQVVCGAPNVRTGVTVAWLPPGATVPSTYENDPFVLEARELRGEVSNGMLASPKELAVGDSHKGLLLLDDDITAGTMFADAYDLRDEVVIDIENKMFTHRPDCFGWIGVAREIAGIQGQKFTSPDWYRSDATIAAPDSETLKLEVRNEIPELVPRFSAVTVSGIEVKPSPVWLQTALSRVGVRPINNIVDFTNYYMLLTGQPLHAYDYDKVVAQDEGTSKATLVIRKPLQGEKLMLLNGKEIEPRSDAILIATANKAIGLGGVMGGEDTEVDAQTKNIILECANFDMYSIRRTSMAHGIFSDAVTRFNKGQSPLQTLPVLAKITADVERYAGGTVASGVVDDNHLPDDVLERNALYPDVHVSPEFINVRLGLSLSADEITQLLENVEFGIKSDGEELVIRAPFWRTDIEIPEDVVEEVGRLYGYDKLPLELPSRSLMPAVKDVQLEAKARLRDVLSKSGANEVLTYSFVHGNLIQKAGQDMNLAFKLSNALSPDLQYYRLSLTPSLLDKVHANIKAGYDEFALFELGKVHAKSEMDKDGLPRELGRLGFVFAASDKKKVQSYDGAPYYQAQKYLHALLSPMGRYEFHPLGEVSFEGHALFEQLGKTYEPGRSAVVFLDGKPAGVIGEYTASVQKAFKLPVFCAGFELFLSVFYAEEAFENGYLALPRFPKVAQDITLRVPADHSYRQVYDAIWKELANREDNALVSLVPLDIYRREDDTGHKRITLRLTMASYEKTLTDSEVSGLLDTIVAAAKAQYGYERV